MKDQHRPRVQVWIPEYAAAKIDNLREGLGAKTRVDAVIRLTQAYEERLESAPIATYDNIMNTKPKPETPVCIFGVPGSGKSWTLKKFLQKCVENRLPLLLIDPTAEHSWVAHDLNYSKAIGFKFKSKTQVQAYRVLLERTQNLRRVQMQTFFNTTMASAMLEGRLRKWVVAIEESHEFVDLKEVNDFVVEARKYTRKVVVASSDPDKWKYLTVPMRPLLH